MQRISKNWMLLAATSALMIIGAGCSDKPNTEGRPIPVASNETWKTERDAAKRSAEVRLEAIDRELDEMNASLEKMGKKAKKETKEAMVALKEESKEMRLKIERLGDAAEDKWQDTKSELNKAADKLESGVKSAWDKLRS